MNSYNVPWVAVGVSSLPALLAYMSVKVTANNVFDFLAATSVTGCLIGWAGICGTYLRFRQAYQYQRIEAEMVPKAVSLLQPYLAWYGFLWAVFLTAFQGYLIYARNDRYWTIVSTSWGFTVSPYLLIGGFVLLLLVWFIVTRLRQGFWTWQIKSLGSIDLVRGVAPKTIKRDSEEVVGWRNLLTRFLNAL